MHLTKRTIESKTVPGCKFTVRTLNSIQRARRDASIAEHRREYTRLTTELAALLKRHIGEGDAEYRRTKLEALEPSMSLELSSLDDQARLIMDEFINPACIRAALVSIEGVEGITLETLFDEASDELLDEVAKACSEASGLTAEQQKN